MLCLAFDVHKACHYFHMQVHYILHTGKLQNVKRIVQTGEEEGAWAQSIALLGFIYNPGLL